MMWYDTQAGSQFRLDRVIAVVVNEQERGEYQCFAVLEGGTALIDLTLREAKEVKERVRLATMRFAVASANALAG